MKPGLRLGLVCTLAAALFASSATSGDKKDFFFQDGDIIVMMGDSITEQLLYSNYVEMWAVTRYPDRKFTFRNVGIGGDRSVGGNARFKRDVLAHKATVLTVDFGMNDGGYAPFNEKTFGVYMKGLQGIADQAKAAKIRVAWVTPQPVEHNPGDKKEFYNDTLEKFSAGVKDIAQKNDGLFIDQFHPYWNVVLKARNSGEKGRITGGDAVHPGPAGQVVMASAILDGLGFNTFISSVDIFPPKAEKTPLLAKCQVEGVKTKGEDGAVTEVHFQRLDEALPFFPDEARSILKHKPLLEEMNLYGLRVRGLKAGNYEVLIDGKKIAAYSDEDLGKGVNLAAAVLAAGPIADQVKEVVKAVKTKNQYFHDQIFRGVLLANAKSPAFKDVEAKDIEAKRQMLYEERMKKMPELDAAVREALRIRPHTFVVRLIEKK